MTLCLFYPVRTIISSCRVQIFPPKPSTFFRWVPFLKGNASRSFCMPNRKPHHWALQDRTVSNQKIWCSASDKISKLILLELIQGGFSCVNLNVSETLEGKFTCYFGISQYMLHAPHRDKRRVHVSKLTGTVTDRGSLSNDDASNNVIIFAYPYDGA